MSLKNISGALKTLLNEVSSRPAGGHASSAVTAATEEQSSYRLSETKTSGMFSGGGLGVTFGSKSLRQQINQDGTTQGQSSSAVGSTGGNVNLIAGEQAHIGGSDVIAKNDVNIVGGSVTVDPGNDMLTRKQIYEQKQSGLTVSLSSPVTDALLTIGKDIGQSGDSGDNRLKALYGMAAIQDGWAAAQDGKVASQLAALKNGDVSASVTLQVNIGASKSKNTSEQVSNQVSGSTVSGGRNVAIVATGANGQTGDVSITGSGVTGNKVTLAAQNDLLLQAASNNSKQTGSNSASGWSAGAHISFGQETGIGVQASGYMAKGSEKGNTTDYVNTRINGQDSVTLSSGKDTTLSGAQVMGDKITADVGRNLTITSLQDIDDYASKQQSVSGGFSFTFGTMNGSASLSMNQSKMSSEYASVGDQSGLFAGHQGYDIYVGDHTQLNGAVIASTADAANNSLNTGTLGWTDIQNKADYKASSVGISVSGSTEAKKDKNGNVIHDSNGKTDQINQLTPPVPTMAITSGNASGTTRSAIGNGTITVRDTRQQTQDVSTLSRDTDDANGHIDKIFDKEKIQTDQQVTQLAEKVMQQTASNVLNQLSTNAKDDASRKLEASAAYQAANADQQKKMVDAAFLNVDKQYGIGSPYWTAATAISGALAGLTGGDMGQALAGGLAPYLSLTVKAATTDAKGNVNEVANITGHALAGAVVAYLQGGYVTGGAVGAATGELAAQLIAKELYPGIKPENLTNEQKANVSALSTLAAGLAGGMAGNSSVAAGTGAVAGKTTVENNALSVDQINGFAIRAKGCEARGDCDQIVKEMEDLSLNQQKEMIAVCSTNSAACKEKYGDIPANGMLVRKALDGLFDADVPSEMKNDISSFWAQQMEAEGVVTSTEFANQLENRYGMDRQESEILAVAVLGAITGGMGKGGGSTQGKTLSAKPEWLQKVQAGNKFNAEQSKNYPYNELYVNKPNGSGYYRVDSYNPATGEIVSRKLTQFSDITETTANRYVHEAVNKYPAGATIAKVPSSGTLGGETLRGSNILEVPPQLKPIPQSVLDAADKAGVIIRDTNGKVY